MNPVTLTWRLLTADELTRVYLHEMCRDFPQGRAEAPEHDPEQRSEGHSPHMGRVRRRNTGGVSAHGAARGLCHEPVGLFRRSAPIPGGRGSAQPCWPSCPATKTARPPSSLRPSVQRRLTTRPWPSGVWAFMPAAGPLTPAGRSIFSTHGSGCWSCPAAPALRTPKPPCRALWTATAAPWEKPQWRKYVTFYRPDGSMAQF